jgi:antitoxin (DNA-binding transcriptional repressor) of toxin-antitoxin stability system
MKRNQQPIARLVAEQKPDRKARKAGSAKGMLTILDEDDEHRKRGVYDRHHPY